MKNIKAVIFDWAGTLIDFGSIAPVQVFMDVLSSKGIEVSAQEVRMHMGLAKKDHLRALLAQERILTLWKTTYHQAPSEEDIEAMYEALTPKMIKLVQHYTTPIPGIPELLTTLKARNIRIGSTTGYVQEMMEVIVPSAQNQGLHLDSVVNPSDCKEGRPSPFMIFRNMENLGIYHVDEIIKVGDTEADMMEGLNAGVWTVGITSSGNEIGMSYEAWRALPEDEQIALRNRAADRLIEAGAHFVIHDLRNLPEIIEEINAILDYPQK